MRKTLLRCWAAACCASLLLSGCTVHVTKNKNASSGATDISIKEDVYALVLPNKESAYDDLIVKGYSDIMEMAGYEYIVERPADSSVMNQQQFVKSLIARDVSCIAIAPVDAEAMADLLKEAMEKGIDICSFDRPADPKSRELAISNLGTDDVAGTLMDAVLEITGGKGQWAILSSSSVSVNQNLWTERMRDVMKEEAYKDLELLEIAYGNDQFQTAYDQTKALIQNYPDLEVICVPTAGGIAAAAKAAADSGTDIKVTGFGLPSEMAEYVGNVCPFFYLWNPVDLGNLTAYVSVALHQDKITGALNEKFKAGDLGEYEVTAAADGGTEVILEHPLRFDQENISKWADVF